MEKKVFPRTMVEDISLPRMIIGSNWLCGFSHRSNAADKMIKSRFETKEAFSPILETFLDSGIDAVMGSFTVNPLLRDGVRYAQEKTGKKIHIIDTPNLNVDDNALARQEAWQAIKKSKENGAEICLLHHMCCEQLVNKNKKEITRLSDYTQMIREAGMVPGLSAHMPEIVVFSDLNEYDVQTYIQIYNPLGFLMQVEVEYIAKVINNAKKPVMTIKPFAAGRTTPYVGLNFVYNTIRDCDMVALGTTSPLEAAEDIEIGFSALERRYPDLQGRTSPVKNQSAFGAV